LIFVYAGILGVEPWSFTLRQLFMMAHARLISDWNMFSALMSLIANCHRDKRYAPEFTPDHFHPLVQARVESEKITVREFYELLTRGKHGECRGD
jgi:hypothetical protein